jgi:hypothetical protein
VGEYAGHACMCMYAWVCMCMCQSSARTSFQRVPPNTSVTMLVRWSVRPCALLPLLPRVGVGATGTATSA